MPGIVGDQVEKEYNELTKRLLAEGYTEENYPKDKVKIPCGGQLPGGGLLNNLYGGFEYIRNYACSMVYKTGCGMFVLGKHVIDDMGFMGVQWCHENDNPVVRCPFDRDRCHENDRRLHGMMGGGLCIQCWCVCHRTDDVYDYDRSFEKEEKKRQEEKERKYQEYSSAHNGRVCRNHMHFNERDRTWTLIYEPRRCASLCYSSNGYCQILGKELSKKKGNVYYDLKKSRIRHDGTLFDGEKDVCMEKGIRYFKRPVSIDICEAFIRIQKDQIVRDYEINHSFEMLSDKSLTYEVLNIRAEARPSRDLMQDLQDIKDGITIVHASDQGKKQKEIKKQRRQQAKETGIKRLEKKILEVGYHGLKECGLDRIHADKWLGEGRIAELEKMRKEKPVQISIFEYMQQQGEDAAID